MRGGKEGGEEREGEGRGREGGEARKGGGEEDEVRRQWVDRGDKLGKMWF